jgi:bifunctional non-homologous end joining protein LigD
MAGPGPRVDAVTLDTYRKKRRFDRTPEPRGIKGKAGGGHFVIQKHAARRLHYDLRLELDGVMKSWAVTKGPSLVPGEKRLAVHVEDHPIDYNAFEGTIPQGEYGGGTVMIWDRGQWIPDGDAHRGYAKGHLAFELKGKKLRGRWHLVRMRKRQGERQEGWLLIKAEDAAARTGAEPDILDEKPNSVVSRRSIQQIARAKGKVWHSNRANAANEAAADPIARRTSERRAESKNATVTPGRSRETPAAATLKRRSRSKAGRDPLPDFVAPCLPTLAARAPSGAGWVHEVKFDGYRIEVWLAKGHVRLLTRTGLDWTDRFGSVAKAFAGIAADTALIDGEIVSEDENGRSDFSALQADLKAGRTDRLVYYAFDLLHLDGRDLRDLPLRDRKATLDALLQRSKRDDRIRLSEHFAADGAVVFAHACRLKLEGVVSKMADAPYRSGRGQAWIKAKCTANQEFVVAGYEPSTAKGRGLRSLVLGYYEDGRLRYAGRVGSGFTQQSSQDVARRLDALHTNSAPFDSIPAEERRRKVRWAKPSLVAEVDFRGWTSAGLVRQGSFKGLREDKPAREIVREAPIETGSSRRPAPAKAPQTPRNPPRTSVAAAPSRAIEVARVALTNPDRVYWADVDVTKQALAEYYAAIWDWIAPHLTRRPLAIVRCPEGIAGDCFFQKHVAAGIQNESLRHPVKTKEKDVIVVDDVAGLVSLVQSGALEIHVRGSKLPDLERCDRIVFDIDPGPNIRWDQIVDAAREIRKRLDHIGLETFVKLSGGKGLHVVLPVASTDWHTAKLFARTVARAMESDAPKLYVSKMVKSLRNGRIFVDYFRNSREATSVAPYSSRARPGAPVSAPVSWRELDRVEGAAHYTVLNLRKRLASLKADPWADLPRVKQKLPEF